jgi:hypothetical protein
MRYATGHNSFTSQYLLLSPHEPYRGHRFLQFFYYNVRIRCRGNKSKSKSNLYYDRRSVSQSVLEESTHLGLTTRSLLLSDSCGFVCMRHSLSMTRGRVYRLLLLLALASAVIFGSEFRGTRAHILLSQIRDFPFRRLLRLAILRWRYSTPSPHGIAAETRLHMFYCPHTNRTEVTVSYSSSIGQSRVVTTNNYNTSKDCWNNNT